MSGTTTSHIRAYKHGSRAASALPTAWCHAGRQPTNVRNARFFSGPCAITRRRIRRRSHSLQRISRAALSLPCSHVGGGLAGHAWNEPDTGLPEHMTLRSPPSAVRAMHAASAVPTNLLVSRQQEGSRDLSKAAHAMADTSGHPCKNRQRGHSTWLSLAPVGRFPAMRRTHSGLSCIPRSTCTKPRSPGVGFILIGIWTLLR